jgi:hypothetical protein
MCNFVSADKALFALSATTKLAIVNTKVIYQYLPRYREPKSHNYMFTMVQYGRRQKEISSHLHSRHVLNLVLVK